ncbi:MAG: TIR domain-containing protein [Pseudonocardiales bacterium]|nr:TIR domain-containing protein [Pseudonocardiales bacterium]MBV9029340.1 TIR domain-containing protein [Pseudonocardiales bacterium]
MTVWVLDGLVVIVARVFISYATPDRVIADEVLSWLQAAGHEPFLAHDLRDGIGVGEEWKQRLYRELREVDAVVGVVTSAFVASNWCSAEVGIADALGCRLMPVRAETGVVHPLMQDLQYADYQADPRQARDRVLHALLEDGGRTWREGDNPFPGLEPFTAALSRVFFGRSAQAREVGSRLRAMGGNGGLLIIVGPSGCGKSSLLNAGVVPLLEGDPEWLVLPSLVPGSDPLPELARVLAITANRLGLGWSAGDVRGRLDAGTDGLRRVVDDLLVAGPGTRPRRLVVMVDQAEELFTRTTPDTVARFVQLLRGAVAGPVRVMVAMRSEFLDDLRDLPTLAGVPIEAYVLAPLDREALREVVERPAKVARLHLDEGLTTQLVADTDSGEALPLLAFILRRLAEGLPVGGTLTLSRYHDLGGVQGALTRHADAAFTEAVRAGGLTEREVLAGLTRLVTVEETGRRGRRRIRLAGLPEPLRVALGVFVERRLLLSDTDDTGQVWLTVAHEALLTGWRPLDTATADITAALRTARAVEQAAAEWTSADRSEHYLWDDKRLTATLATLGMTGDHNPAAPLVELDDEARAFLDATTRRVTLTKERERRRRTRTTTVLSTLLVLALIASVFAFQQRGTAQTQRDNATFNQITAQADRLRDTDVSLAAQLDITAYRMRPTPDLSTALITDADAALSTPLVGHTGFVDAVAFSPDGHTVATGSADRTVRLWNVADPAHPTPLGQPLPGHADSVDAVAFSPDGRTLATGSYDRTVRLWDVADPAHPTLLGSPLTGHTDWVFAVAFSPDGRTLATGSADRTVRLWDVADPAHPMPLGQPLPGHADSVFAVAFSPGGRTLASGSYDRTVRLWDVADPAHPTSLGSPLTGHTDHVTAVVFSPDGRTLASGSVDRTVRLWDVGDPAHPASLGPPLVGHINMVWAVVFSPDGHILATASYDQTVRLWNVGDPAHPTPLGSLLIGHTGPVFAVAFSPDGRTLATGSADRTARLWTIPYAPTTGHTGAVYDVELSRDGHTLASGSADRTVRLWDVADPAHHAPLGSPLTGHTDVVDGLAFSPDGRTLASAGYDRTVRLWNVADPAHPAPLGPPLTGHTDHVGGVAFSPDGRILATGGVDRTVRLWNVADPAHPIPLGPPLTGHTGGIGPVVFSPDGRTLATGSSDRTVRLWNMADPAHPTPLGSPLAGHANAVSAVAFSPDGRTLATASDDHTLRLWNVADPAHPTPLGPPLTGHAGTVSAVAFSPDGRTLASAGYDRTVRLWNVADPAHPTSQGRPLTGHTNFVTALAFSPDGHTLATGGADQTVRLWETDVDRAIQRICAATANTLTPATWAQYVSPDLRYHPPCT